VISFGLFYSVVYWIIWNSLDQKELDNPHFKEIINQDFLYQSKDYRKSLHKECSSKTGCIDPVLHLRKEYRVFLCPNTTFTGVRFYTLLEEGLRDHPLIERVESVEEADYVIMSSISSRILHCPICWEKSKKLILIDPGDIPDIRKEVMELSPLAIFKRSFFRKISGRVGLPTEPLKGEIPIFPLTFSIPDEYLTNVVPRLKKRHIDAACTLRIKNKQVMRQNSHINMWFIYLFIASHSNPLFLGNL